MCVCRLLDVIAGRKDPRGLRSGQVLVDNKLVTSELRLISAYVVQVREIFRINFSHPIKVLRLRVLTSQADKATDIDLSLCIRTTS